MFHDWDRKRYLGMNIDRDSNGRRVHVLMLDYVPRPSRNSNTKHPINHSINHTLTSNLTTKQRHSMQKTQTC